MHPAAALATSLLLIPHPDQPRTKRNLCLRYECWPRGQISHCLSSGVTARVVASRFSVSKNVPFGASSNTQTRDAAVGSPSPFRSLPPSIKPNKDIAGRGGTGNKVRFGVYSDAGPQSFRSACTYNPYEYLGDVRLSSMGAMMHSWLQWALLCCEWATR